MLFLWLKQNPPLNKILLLVFKRVLILILKRVYQFEIISQVRYQFENASWKTKILKLVVVRSFCFGLILSPPLAWIAKNGIIRALCKTTFSPLANKTWVKIIPKMENCSERRRRMSYGVEWKPLSSPKTPIPFQYTYDLVWNTLENTLVIAYERDMIKGIFMSYVCNLAKEISRIKDIELMPKFVKGLFI
jgi:hypothetical protein